MPTSGRRKLTDSCNHGLSLASLGKQFYRFSGLIAKKTVQERLGNKSKNRLRHTKHPQKPHNFVYPLPLTSPNLKRVYCFFVSQCWSARLWHRQRGQAPGLAMSRGLGDALGNMVAKCEQNLDQIGSTKGPASKISKGQSFKRLLVLCKVGLRFTN